MITIKTVQNIRKGSLITLWNGIYAIAVGILLLIFWRFIIKSNFRSIDTVWSVFLKYNPDIGWMFVRSLLLKAVFVITIGIVIIYLSNYILRKKDKTAWVILFAVGLIFWPSLLTIEILDKNFYTIIASFIGWVTFIIGMLIPIRYYLQREYSEY